MQKKILYILLVFVLCLIPSVGVLFYSQDETAEKRSLSEFPGLVSEEGEWNPQWLSEAGDYFQDHFAFRKELVTADAKVKSTLFGVSADDGVIDGTDGWLYYMDSLDDYLGKNMLEDRELFNISHSLALMQEYAGKKGVSFLFVPVPNKNTLYGENMPYYYRSRVSEESNRKRLLAYLDSEGVNYLNLTDFFKKKKEILYHKTDSHWTNRGAALAADEIFSVLGKDVTDWEKEPYEVRKDFEGDLEVMLYPGAVTPEEEVYYDRKPEFQYREETKDNFQPKIWTEQGGGTGSLVMYRDSFGNALLPFLADGFDTAYFSRGEPFYLSDLDVNQADTLVVERVERFLPNLAKNAAIMPAPMRDGIPEGYRSFGTYRIACTYTEEAAAYQVLTGPEGAQEGQEGVITCKPEGMGLRIEGSLSSKAAAEESRIYVRINGEDVYEAFPITLVTEARNPWGYRLVLDALKTEEIFAKQEEMRVEIFADADM